MKKIFAKTVSAVLFLASATAGAAQRNVNYSCNVEGSPRYKTAHFSLIIGIENGQSRAAGIRLELNGQRNQINRTQVIPQSQPMGTPGTSVSVFQNGQSGQVNLNGSQTSSQVPLTGPGSYIAPAPQWIETVEVVPTSETLIYDYDYELVLQQYLTNEAEEENKEIFWRNEGLKDERKQLLESATMTYFEGTSKQGFPPLQLEPNIPTPRAVQPLIMKIENGAGKPGQPISNLNVSVDGTPFAELNCYKTHNLVDNVSAIDKDVKAYNKGGGDPRAAKNGAAMGLPTAGSINRQTRDWWCNQQTLIGTMDLRFFDRGTLKVRCNFTGDTKSDN